jgi:hypothetical protein
LEALRSVFPEIDSAPHMDTLERLLEEIPAQNIEDVLGNKIARQLRSKKLQALLVEKHYVVAIDGSQKFTRTVPFAEEALHRQKGDQITYVIYVLEAALVGPQGISIPILAEFCENKALFVLMLCTAVRITTSDAIISSRPLKRGNLPFCLASRAVPYIPSSNTRSSDSVCGS